MSETSIRMWRLVGGLVAALLVGAPSASAEPVPQPAPILVDAGYYATCATDTPVSVVCWGSGTPPSKTPAHIRGLPEVPISSLAIDTINGCVVQEGEIWCWNSVLATVPGVAVRIPDITNAVSVHAANTAMCALLRDGRVICWGRNSYGISGSPTSVGVVPPTFIAGISDAIALDGAHSNMCVIRSNGSPWCWGYNGHGELGTGTAGDNNFVPVEVGTDAQRIRDAASISMGLTSGCVVHAAGTVACWGSNGGNALGGPSTATRPIVEVPGVSGAKTVASGNGSQCALLEDGHVTCWGSYDQLGRGPRPAGAPAVAGPGLVPGLSGVQTLTAGLDQFCALTATDTQCWGGNLYGDLGDGSDTRRYTPVHVVGSEHWGDSRALTDAVVATEGPFTEISTTHDLRCGRIAGGVRTPPLVGPWGCGTWLSEDSVLYGPRSADMLDAFPQTKTWIPIGQDISGNGSADNPWTITTLARSNTVLVTQTDEYVKDADHTTTRIELVNPDTHDHTLVLSVAGDCQHRDRWNEPTSIGFGWRSAADIRNRATGCSDKAYSGQTLTWQPGTDGSHFTTNTPAAIGRQLADRAEFDDACLCATEIDDAAGLSWSATLAPGQKKVVSYQLKLGTGDPQQPTPPPIGPIIPWFHWAIGVPDVWSGDDDPTNDKPDREPRTGKGQTVAIVDTGVNAGHPWLENHVRSEACRTTQIPGLGITTPPLVEGSCYQDPSVLNQNAAVTGLTGPGQFEGPGMAAPREAACLAVLFTCGNLGEDTGLTFFQGTFVAGLAAGKNPDGIGGVAPDASVIAANVASWRQQRAVISNPNDAAWALRWVDKQRGSRSIAAVELMLPNRILPGDVRTFATGPCTGHSPALEKAIHTLTSHNIAVVVPAGDDGRKGMLPWPACLPDVISVGATTGANGVLKSSNSSRVLTILAPGERITSAKMNDDGTITRSGTFAAAGLVTGAIALYKQHRPTATLRQVRKAMTSTGIPTKDSNGGGTTPRLRVDLMLGSDGR